MKQPALAVVTTLMVCACAAGPAGDDRAVPATSMAALNGERYYEDFCAGCHETGMLGAPVAGLATDWEGRSQLWDAVLFDHAITGYFEMPARGGRADLPEDVVKAAAEYMLRKTFPDRQHDCNPPVCGEPGDVR
jgi:cytochrome c5